jgi:hypothetical protein
MNNNLNVQEANRFGSYLVEDARMSIFNIQCSSLPTDLNIEH